MKMTEADLAIARQLADPILARPEQETPRCRIEFVADHRPLGDLIQFQHGDMDLIEKFVHRDALVAWDRDCAHVELISVFSGIFWEKIPLRIAVDSRGFARAYTGRSGNEIASWDATLRRWSVL